MDKTRSLKRPNSTYTSRRDIPPGTGTECLPFDPGSSFVVRRLGLRSGEGRPKSRTQEGRGRRRPETGDLPSDYSGSSRVTGNYCTYTGLKGSSQEQDVESVRSETTRRDRGTSVRWKRLITEKLVGKQRVFSTPGRQDVPPVSLLRLPTSKLPTLSPLPRT